MASGSFTFTGLPTGDVTITGEAFKLSCSAIAPDAVPTWVSDPLAVNLQPGVSTPISLSFRPNGRLDLSVIFQDDTCTNGGCDGGGAGGDQGMAGQTGAGGGVAGGGVGGAGGSVGAGGAVAGAGGGVAGTGGLSGMGGLPAGTMVGGILNQDTSWTATGSPYRLTREVQVAPNVTLTIGAGTVVEGAGFAITTWGTLQVLGVAGNEARFHAAELNPGGSNGAPAVMAIDHAIIDGGSLWHGNQPSYGSLMLTNSVVRDMESGAFIYLWYPPAACTVTGNVFVRSGGISIGTQGTTVLVKNNVFYQPTTSFAVENWASYGGPSTTVTGNTFLDTTAIAVAVPPLYTSALLDARGNYWNTTDPSVIAGMIFDQNDDLRSDSLIQFQPFLLAPDPATPDYGPWVN
jgi:hypothetical protein